ncbi:MAG: hydroxyacylglutathione hydrolase [Pseudanabaenaceae cyanobacterium]
MDIYRLPALQDNYIFLLVAAPDQAVAIDPGEPFPVLQKLAELGIPLTAIWHTHHHGDHVGANRDLLARFPEVPIYASAYDRGRIPGQTHDLHEGDRLPLGEHTAEVWEIPGHTQGHLAYWFPETGDLFCGDTLFAGGCGRLIEGTAAQMQRSLARLRGLPDRTRVWCTHEYTLGNLRFALTVEPDNPDLQTRYENVLAQRRRGEATVPTRMDVERATNPFLRWESPTLQAVVGSADPVAVLAGLRQRKDRFTAP